MGKDLLCRRFACLTSCEQHFPASAKRHCFEWAFSSCGEQGLLSGYVARASHGGGGGARNVTGTRALAVKEPATVPGSLGSRVVPHSHAETTMVFRALGGGQWGRNRLTEKTEQASGYH